MVFVADVADVVVIYFLQDGSRIASIAENIHKTLEELLQKLTPENIKCVCQTLKVRVQLSDMGELGMNNNI